VAVADAAVGPVGGDHQVVIGPVVEVGARLMLEMERHSQCARPLLEDVQQALAADADEAVARRADRLARRCGPRYRPNGRIRPGSRRPKPVVPHQVLDRLIGEDHAPAERVVGPVALEQMHLVPGSRSFMDMAK
jgi:hypothetical protein